MSDKAETRLDALIALLVDKSARVDERDDGAIDLGAFDDDKAVEALLRVGSDSADNEVVLSSCGESLAEIAIRTGRFDRTWLNRLAATAANELIATLRAERPTLLGR